MQSEVFKDWMTVLGFGGIVGTVIALLLKSVFDRKSQESEHRWQDERALRSRTQDTDRATYNQTLTILAREHLARFIRTGEWAMENGDLRQVLTGFSQRTYEHFLDPVVNQAWEHLVAETVKLASRRLSNQIWDLEIQQYNRLLTEWEDICKRSFGPLGRSGGGHEDPSREDSAVRRADTARGA